MEAKEMAKTAQKSNETAKLPPISSTTIGSNRPTTDTTATVSTPQHGISSMKVASPLPSKISTTSTASRTSSLPSEGVSKLEFPVGGARKLPPQNGKNATLPQHYNARATAGVAVAAVTAVTAVTVPATAVPAAVTATAVPATAAVAVRTLNSGNDRVTVDRSAHKPLVPPSSSSSTLPSSRPNTKLPTKLPPYPPASFQPPLSLPPSPKKKVISTTLPTKLTIAKTPHNPGETNKIMHPTVPTVGPHPSDPKLPTMAPTTTTTTTPATTVTNHLVPALQPPPVLDEAALIEEAIRKARAPLTDKYGPYIVPSDKTLKEARNRLRRAIEQTRQLRAAFTERVYGKYRVCLRPPPTRDQIFNRVMSDPARTHKELDEEIKQLKSEKEIEKKEAQKLNAEITAASTTGEGGKATAAAVNAETAEQLMFITAGLSLIILPEHDVAGTIDMSGYPDRAPMNPETGQRVRSISAAAAAAGEVMLDRARKGATMRIERQRRRQLQIMAGEDPEKDADNNYSRLSLLSNASRPALTKPMMPRAKVEPTSKSSSTSTLGTTGSTATPSITPKAFKRQAPKPATPALSPTVSAKAIRARVQATMSNNTLLSLNPSAEELRTDGKCGAATMAMMDQGVGAPTGKAAQQQRYRHPFPNSIGGRHRAFGGNNNNNNNMNPQQLSLALPPLPAAKERRLRKPVPVMEAPQVATTRANNAIRGILGQYVVGDPTINEQQPPRKRRRTKISFLHGLEYSQQNRKGPKIKALHKDVSDVSKDTIDPILTFNVLRAVGLIKSSVSDADVENGSLLSVLDSSLIQVAEKTALGEDGGQSQSSIATLKELTNKFSSKKRTFVNAFFAPPSKTSPSHAAASTKSEVASKDDASKPSTIVGESKKGGTVESAFEKQNGSSNGEGKSCEPVTGPAAVSIRGGGQELAESNDNTETKSQVPTQQNLNASPATGPKTASSALNENDKTQQNPGRPGPRPMNVPATAGNPVHATGLAPHRMVLMHPQLARADQGYRRTTAAHQSALAHHGNSTNNASHNNRVQGQRQSSDSYHHPSAANALQIAHQLHHASASMQRLSTHAPGELEAYMGGLHAQPGAAGYEWSQIAALGLNPHRAAMVNFTQGRARAMLAARGQQNAAAAAVAHAAATQRALMGGAYVPGAAAHFSHVSGHAATLMNSSAALIGHSGMSPISQSAPAVGVHARKSDNSNAYTKTPEQSGSKDNKDTRYKKDQKDDASNHSSGKSEESGRKRKLSSASSDSTQSEKRRNTSKSTSGKATSQNRSDATNTIGANMSNVTDSPKKVAKPRVPPKGNLKGSSLTKSNQKKTAGPGLLQPNGSNQVSKATSSARVENGKMSKPPQTSGMQFYVPPAPPGIPSDMASLVLQSRVFEVIDAWESGEVVFDATAIIDYLLAVGIAVPIPKALVVNPLKERIGATSMKNNSFGNIPASSREVIVALILLWLWKHHEDCFQKTFAKSGRIDVDPECKWLINAAVNRSVSALSQEIAKPGSPLSAALTLAKSKGGSSQKAVPGSDMERPQGRTTKVDLLSASIVSKSLLAGTSVDEKMVS
jgi:hypothetical protein